MACNGIVGVGFSGEAQLTQNERRCLTVGSPRNIKHTIDSMSELTWRTAMWDNHRARPSARSAKVLAPARKRLNPQTATH